MVAQSHGWLVKSVQSGPLTSWTIVQLIILLDGLRGSW